MSRKGLSLRKLLLLTILLAGALPLGFFLVAGTGIVSSRLESQVIERMCGILAIGEQQLLERSSRTFHEAESMASNPVLFEIGNREGEKFDMKRLQAIYSIFRRQEVMLTLLSDRGNPIASNLVVGPSRGGNSLAFQEALAGRTSVSRSHLLIGSKKPVIALYHPVDREADKVKHVARQYIPLSEICPDLKTEGSFIWMDAYGDLLHADGLEPLTPLTEHFSGWTPEEDHGEFIRRATGETLYFVQVPLPDMELSPDSILLFTYPKHTALAALDAGKRWALLAALGSFLLLTFFAVLTSSWLSRPIRAAANAAAKVARGDLSVRLPDQGPDELRQLSTTLNAMTNEVRKRREILEDLVAKRTRSLAEVGAFLQATMDSFQDALLVIGPSGETIHFINREASKLFQIDPRAQRVEGLLPRIRHWFEDPGAWESFWDRMQFSTVTIERRFATCVEDIEVLEVTSAPVKGEQGQPLGRLWLFRDVTARERDEAKQRQSQKLEAVGRLASGIAHDFNNILTAIQGGIEMARLNLEDGETPDEFLETGLLGCQRAAGVVRQLLTFSSQRPVALLPVQVESVVQETIALVRTSIDPKIEIQSSAAENLPPIKADNVQIEQVLMNLIINASHAMESGTISVDCRYEPVPSDKAPFGVCLIEVQDTGHGMSPEVMAKIFDPFFTTKAQGKGTGLGLATSIGIVERHGGSIHCESTVDVGTTFTLRFPAMDAMENAPALPEPIQITEALSSSILIVDDEPAIHRIARRSLERAQHRVDEALDGAACLQKVAQNHYDLIILDLTMPKLSGAETLARLRKDWPTIPILVWSGHSEDAEAMFTHARGPDAFLAKPFSSSNLQDAVSELLRKKRSTESQRNTAS